METENRFEWKTNGRALSCNTVTGKNYRITMLTDRLIRLEYDENGRFEDRATQRVFYRDFPETAYSCREDGGFLIVETKFLTLRYAAGKPFSAETLSLKLQEKPYTFYRYGDPLTNLKGTARTLDKADGAVPLHDGVCSKDGIALIDDSTSAALENGWFSLRNPETDVYLFAYGHDYLAAVKALIRLTGDLPFLPAYALGNWWSRYYAYSEDEYKALVTRFEEEEIPFSVAIIDMDWHPTEVPEEAVWDGMQGAPGWTGYSWNEELFPDYKRFLNFLHDHGLKTAMNLHPAQGIRCHEKMYREMAEKCGIDPETKKPVKLDLLNPDFMKLYFDVLHHPYEENGVDFWWMDWQQGTDYWWIHDEDHKADPLETIDPLWLLNHLHILDIMRNGKRPMFFSRYAGIGSQRYPIGFSGDTAITWESLDFQPYFTNTATNAAYAWWSHDIGGHMFGYRDDELATRWVEYGVFSPINRLHSTKNEFTRKEPWCFSLEHEIVQEWYLRLRHRLFPYLYTMNRRANAESEPLIQPMYYEAPETIEAYEAKNEYRFGTELLVAPVTRPADKASLCARTDVWFPEGLWFDCFFGLHYEGGRKTSVYRRLDEYPVFAKAGAIVPTEDDMGDNKLGLRECMTVYVFPGDNGEFTLYEDEGDGDGYRNGKFVTTRFTLEWNEEAVFTIHRPKGDVSLLPESRYYTVALRGFSEDAVIRAENASESYYDPETMTFYLEFDRVTSDDTVQIFIRRDTAIGDNKAKARERFREILTKSQLSMKWKEELLKTDRPWRFQQSCSREERETMFALNEMKEVEGIKWINVGDIY